MKKKKCRTGGTIASNIATLQPMMRQYAIGGTARSNIDFASLKGRINSAYNSDNISYIYNRLASKGLGKAQISAILATIIAESGGNPMAIGDNGKAKGLLQWHADRYVPKSNDSKQELDNQINHILNTIDTVGDGKSWLRGNPSFGYESGAHAKEIFNTSKNLDEITRAITLSFIRPADSHGAPIKRAKIAREIYSLIGGEPLPNPEDSIMRVNTGNNRVNDSINRLNGPLAKGKASNGSLFEFNNFGANPVGNMMASGIKPAKQSTDDSLRLGGIATNIYTFKPSRRRYDIGGTASYRDTYGDITTNTYEAGAGIQGQTALNSAAIGGGLGSAAGAATGAILSSTATAAAGAGAGAASGAALGSWMGPIGTALGALVGLGIGLFSGRKKKRAAKEAAARADYVRQVNEGQSLIESDTNK